MKTCVSLSLSEMAIFGISRILIGCPPINFQGCLRIGNTKMVVQGVVHNGVVIPNEPLGVPEGTQVRIEITIPEIDAIDESIAPRQGGWLKGQVIIAPDFDELPNEIRESFGMN